MVPERDLMDLEHAGWQALATGGDTAAAFYGDVLASEILMLLPGGMLIDDRQIAIASMSGGPWDGFELTDVRVHDLGGDCAVVAYRADATRAGEGYAALVSSTYVREDGHWRLALHQQTPT